MACCRDCVNPRVDGLYPSGHSINSWPGKISFAKKVLAILQDNNQEDKACQRIIEEFTNRPEAAAAAADLDMQIWIQTIKELIKPGRSSAHSSHSCSPIKGTGSDSDLLAMAWANPCDYIDDSVLKKLTLMRELQQVIGVQFKRWDFMLEVAKTIIIAWIALRTNLKSFAAGFVPSVGCLFIMEKGERMSEEAALCRKIAEALFAVWSVYHHLKGHGHNHSKSFFDTRIAMPFLLGLTIPFTLCGLAKEVQMHWFDQEE